MLTVYTGPMFAGKTKNMILDVNNRKEAVLFAKPTKDTRYEDIATHDGFKQSCVSHDSFLSIVEHAISNSKTTIGLDEAHMFDDLIEGLELAERFDIDVVMALLSGDFRRKTFPGVSDVFARSESIIFLKAKCQCGKEASFTKRSSPDTETIYMVGGSELYRPVCRKCHQKMEK
jgi:thymidine kinase